MIPVAPTEPSLYEALTSTKGLGNAFKRYDEEQKTKSGKFAALLGRIQEALLSLSTGTTTTQDHRKAWSAMTWTRNSQGTVVSESDGGNRTGYSATIQVVGYVIDPASTPQQGFPTETGWVTQGGSLTGFPSAVMITWQTPTELVNLLPGPGVVRITVMPAATFGFRIDQNFEHASRQCVIRLPTESRAFVAHLRAEPSFLGEDVESIAVPIGMVYCELL